MTIRPWKLRFLLDIWAEPREADSLPAVIRGRVRDLGGSREQYVGSFEEIEQLVEQRLDEEGIEPRRWERP